MKSDASPAEQWTPVRFLRQNAVCSFCGFRIAKGSPGHTTGTRGTRCWWNNHLRVYECMPCRSDGVRVEIERDALADLFGRAEAITQGEHYDLVFRMTGVLLLGGVKFLQAMRADELDALVVRVATDAEARELEAPIRLANDAALEAYYQASGRRRPTRAGPPAPQSDRHGFVGSRASRGAPRAALAQYLGGVQGHTPAGPSGAVARG